VHGDTAERQESKFAEGSVVLELGAAPTRRGEQLDEARARCFPNWSVAAHEAVQGRAGEAAECVEPLDATKDVSLGQLGEVDDIVSNRNPNARSNAWSRENAWWSIEEENWKRGLISKDMIGVLGTLTPSG